MNIQFPKNIRKLTEGNGRGGSNNFHCSCGGKTGVNDSRPAGAGIRRRRVCLSCGKRITTYELHLQTSVGMLEQAEGVARKAELVLAASAALQDEIAVLRKVIEAHRTLEAARYGSAGPL